MGGGSGGPEGGVQRPRPVTHSQPPAPRRLAPPQHGAAPRGAGTLCKARRTYIGRAVRRARAAPVRSAPLPAASVLLGRPPSAAARQGRRLAPAGPLAARLPTFASVLGALPAAGDTEGAGVRHPSTRNLSPAGRAAPYPPSH